MKQRHLLQLYSRVFANYGQARNFTTNVDTFDHDFKEHHVSINSFQRLLLTAGSAAVSLVNPYRADMIACLGETSGEHALRYMLRKMEESKEGTEILNDRPRINTSTVDLKYLKKLPEGTLGRTYYNFLVKNQVTPDSRMTVQFIDDIKLAYVIQRYREAHDLIHTVLQMPTHMLGEVTVKWVEAIQTKLPMCIGGAIFGPIRLKPKHRQLYRNYYLPWALKTGIEGKFLLNVYFEKRWEQSLSEFYEEMNIRPLEIKQSPKKSKTV
ncbi:ubiquinone biosynthesis protein COQ4 homolog, mitochondrial [Anoplophora glabripennis]|uniref:ubiquinone biosynthesis protein COQ4 homolog, mitochondrial n=1 Tax=Anoplophora glabripennis TaxID=217634 RepID=UPI0008746CFB|nr:ubiquinone biosynthesis protein COQ4 homolog, mitochondrial [Anoplophora glabripennis]